MEYQLDMFYRNSKSKDGRKSECKLCSEKRKTQYKRDNPEKIYEQDRRSKSKRLDKNRESYRKYYSENREKLLLRNREWRISNQDKVRKYGKDKKSILAKNLRNRVSKALNGGPKTQKTLALLGCDIDFLVKHLESKFLDGMCWENYGTHGWHVDHIIPCCKFDLTDPSQQSMCFHYSNLQPLWAKDNHSKGGKAL